MKPKNLLIGTLAVLMAISATACGKQSTVTVSSVANSTTSAVSSSTQTTTVGNAALAEDMFSIGTLAYPVTEVSTEDSNAIFARLQGSYIQDTPIRVDEYLYVRVYKDASGKYMFAWQTTAPSSDPDYEVTVKTISSAKNAVLYIDTSTADIPDVAKAWTDIEVTQTGYDTTGHYTFTCNFPDGTSGDFRYIADSDLQKIIDDYQAMLDARKA